MWFRRRNSITISNSDIPPAHIASVKSVPAKAAPAKHGPSKLTKSRPQPPKETTSTINQIGWPLERSLNYDGSHDPYNASFQPYDDSRRIEDSPNSLLQDHWGYIPSARTTMTSGLAHGSNQHGPVPPLPPPPPVPHLTRPRMPSPINLNNSPREMNQYPVYQHSGSPYTPPPASPLPDITSSPSFRANSPAFAPRTETIETFPLNRSPQWPSDDFQQATSPASSNFPSNFSGSSVSTQPYLRSRPQAPTPHTMSDPNRPAPLRVSKQYSPTTPSSGLSPTESFSSPLHTRQPSRTPSNKFNFNPSNDLTRNRSVRLSADFTTPGRPRAFTQPTSPNYHFRTPPASPPMEAIFAPRSPDIPPTQMVHHRSASSPNAKLANTSSLRTRNYSPTSPMHNVRKQFSASSMSIAIDTADEDAISAMEEAVEETISQPSLTLSSLSDRTSGSDHSSRPVSPLTPTMSPADAPVVTPRPPSPSNSARPTSPTCSVRPVSPTQFVITSTPRESSPAPSARTAKTVYSIPEDSTLLPAAGLTKTSSADSDTLTRSGTARSSATSGSKLPTGNMPTFPSRHEFKKVRKAYLAAQAEAKRQSAKMGVEGILSWDADKRAWVCKMSDEEKKAWLEKMTDGKAGPGGGKGSSEWGRGHTIDGIGTGVARGKSGLEVGIRGQGRVVDVGGS